MSEKLQITGTYQEVWPEQTFPSGFTKRAFRIEYESNGYKNDLVIDLLKDNVTLIDKFDVGDTIICHLNISSREWVPDSGDPRWFTSAVAWKIEKVETEEAEPMGDPDGEDNMSF